MAHKLEGKRVRVTVVGEADAYFDDPSALFEKVFTAKDVEKSPHYGVSAYLLRNGERSHCVYSVKLEEAA